MEKEDASGKGETKRNYTTDATSYNCNRIAFARLGFFLKKKGNWEYKVITYNIYLFRIYVKLLQIFRKDKITGW